MKIHALITTLVLGSSSVAMADPVTVSAHAEWTFGNRPAPVTVVRDHRDVRPLRAPVEPVRYNPWRRGYQQPILLGSNLHFSGNRTFINVLGEGRFTSLRLDGFNGQSLIYQVAIEFENGQTQVIRNLNRVIDGSRPLMLDLAGRARRIHRVIVYGKPMYNTYPGMGYRIMQPSFSVSAL